MKVVEIFQSIQGEGVRVGIPSVFVRLRGCNLHCKECDTKYAWSGESEDFTPEDLASKVQSFRSSEVVITGGEPFIWQEELVRLCDLLSDSYFVTVETNGTLPLRVNAFLSISPKLSSMSPGFLPDVSVLDFLVTTHDHQLKFVISSEEDAREALEIVERMKTKPQNILFMPRGKSRAELLEVAPTVVEICKKYGVRYSPRLHIWIWDTRRGV